MPRVLIVDREEAAQALIERRLGADLIIESATNVQTALDDHNRNSYEVVVWNTMSAPSPCSTPVRILKKFLKNHVGTRAIVLSDVKEPEIIRMRSLPCEWLKQPVDETELIARIESTAHSKAPLRGGLSGTANLVVPVEFEGIL